MKETHEYSFNIVDENGKPVTIWFWVRFFAVMTAALSVVTAAIGLLYYGVLYLTGGA